MRAEWATLRRGTLAALAVRGVLMAGGFLTSVLLARSLPRAELGAYFLFMQAASVGIVLSLFGTSNVVQRFIPQLRGRARAVLLGRVARIAAVGFVAFGVLCAVAGLQLTSSLGTGALLLLLASALLYTLAGAIEELVATFFCSVRRVVLGVVLMGLPKQLLFLAALVLPLSLGERLSLSLVVVLRAGTGVAVAAFALVLLVRELRRASDAGGVVPPTRGLTRIAAPMAMHLLACNLLGSIDLWCVGLFLGPGEAGMYGAMMRLALLLGVVVHAINSVLPPLLSKLHGDGDRDSLEALARRAATLGGWCALSILLLLAAAGPAVVRLCFGPGFSDGYVVLLVLAAGQTVYAWSGAGGWLLQMTGHEKLMMRITLWGLLANLALSLFAVRIWGAVGVAVTTTLSLAAQSACRMVCARRIVGVRTHAFLNPLRAFAR